MVKNRGYALAAVCLCTCSFPLYGIRTNFLICPSSHLTIFFVWVLTLTSLPLVLVTCLLFPEAAPSSQGSSYQEKFLSYIELKSCSCSFLSSLFHFSVWSISVLRFSVMWLERAWPGAWSFVLHLLPVRTVQVMWSPLASVFFICKNRDSIFTCR